MEITLFLVLSGLWKLARNSERSISRLISESFQRSRVSSNKVYNAHLGTTAECTNVSTKNNLIEVEA